MDFKLEKQMKEPVVKWLEGQGYFVAYEILLSGWCDLVGCKWAERVGRRIPTILEAMAIELKLDDIGGAIYQAKWNLRIGASRSYAAMPLARIDRMRPATIRRFGNEGIGLLGVSPDEITIITESTQNETISSQVAKRLWNAKLRYARRSL